MNEYGTPETESDLAAYCGNLADRAADARRALSVLTAAQRTTLLRAVAEAIRASAPAILEANTRDRSDGAGLSEAMLDRLALDDARIDAIATAVEQIAGQPDPVGEVVEGRVLPNGIRLEKRRVPLGTVLVIYESRPNVTADAAALCLKAGNAVILRGGKEARHSNRALAEAIAAPLCDAGVADAVQLVATTDRAATTHLVTMRGRIDLCVPRGGPNLIDAVANAATIPVVKHDAGNCHLYIDAHLDGLRDEAIAIAINAKTHRYGVCNAIETLLVHEAQLDTLAAIGERLNELGVELRACERSRSVLPDAKPATDEDYATEFLAPVLAVRTVASLEEAADHIRRFGSQHTEAIVTSSLESSQRFVQLVDSANVMVNCSTRFADGGEYGLGAEIGISTDKLHARGPMGARDLTTYQWVLTGSGQVR
jgi:glutamate-5-semialdehyde dehydrogenase